MARRSDDDGGAPRKPRDRNRYRYYKRVDPEDPRWRMAEQKVVGLREVPPPTRDPSNRKAQEAFALLYELRKEFPSVRNGVLEALRARATPTDYVTELAWPGVMVYLTPEMIIEVVRPALAKFRRVAQANVVRVRTKPPPPRPPDTSG